MNIAVRDEQGKTEGHMPLNEWLVMAKEAGCYDETELADIKEALETGHTYRVDMNLGAFCDLIPQEGA